MITENENYCFQNLRKQKLGDLKEDSHNTVNYDHTEDLAEYPTKGDTKDSLISKNELTTTNLCQRLEDDYAENEDEQIRKKRKIKIRNTRKTGNETFLARKRTIHNRSNKDSSYNSDKNTSIFALKNYSKPFKIEKVYKHRLNLKNQTPSTNTYLSLKEKSSITSSMKTKNTSKIEKKAKKKKVKNVLEDLRKSKFLFSLSNSREKFKKILYNKKKMLIYIKELDYNELIKLYKKLKRELGKAQSQKHSTLMIKAYLDSYFYDYFFKTAYYLMCTTNKPEVENQVEKMLRLLVNLEDVFKEKSILTKEEIVREDHNNLFVQEKGERYPNSNICLIELVKKGFKGNQILDANSKNSKVIFTRELNENVKRFKAQYSNDSTSNNLALESSLRLDDLNFKQLNISSTGHLNVNSLINDFEEYSWYFW